MSALPDAASRLTAERALLSRETTMLRSLTSTPAPDLRYSPYNPTSARPVRVRSGDRVGPGAPGHGHD